jgi:rubrerythrin
MARNLICSECGGTMQIGYIPDTATIWARRLFWVSGHNESVKGGVFEKYLDVAKKTKYYITAYRCEECGYIKIFAEQDGM